MVERWFINYRMGLPGKSEAVVVDEPIDLDGGYARFFGKCVPRKASAMGPNLEVYLNGRYVSINPAPSSGLMATRFRLPTSEALKGLEGISVFFSEASPIVLKSPSGKVYEIRPPKEPKSR
jgi:hypothetical protein